MSFALQIVLCLAVAVLTVFLVLLLIQARRTAAAVERLADCATQDLRRVSEDIHELRKQIDGVAGLLRGTLELPSTLTQVVAGIVQALPSFLHRRKNSSSWIESLLAGIQTALHLVRRPKADLPEEATHE